MNLTELNKLMDNINKKTADIFSIRGKIEELLSEVKQCKEESKFSSSIATLSLTLTLASGVLLSYSTFHFCESAKTAFYLNDIYSNLKKTSRNEELLLNMKLDTKEEFMNLLKHWICMILEEFDIYFVSQIFKEMESTSKTKDEEYLEKRELILDLIKVYNNELTTNTSFINTLSALVNNNLALLEDDEELMTALNNIINTQNCNINYVKKLNCDL